MTARRMRAVVVHRFGDVSDEASKRGRATGKIMLTERSS
jgi:hypothetical protein